MSSLARFRLITFDVTNTLLQFRTSRVKQYGEIGALFGVLCDNNDLAINFKNNWNRMNRIHPNFGCNSNMEWQYWWRQLIGHTFADSGAEISAEKLDKLSSHLVELYKSSLCWQHCNGSIDLLKYLRAQQDDNKTAQRTSNFVMGVIANFDPRLNTLLRNMKIDKYFDFVLNSYDCKFEKPDARIFEEAIRSTNLMDVQAHQCLHIGDGPTTDYLGAINAGWSAVLVHEKNADYLIKKYGNDIDANFVFPSLYDFHKKLLNNSIKW